MKTTYYTSKKLAKARSTTTVYITMRNKLVAKAEMYITAAVLKVSRISKRVGKVTELKVEKQRN